MCSGARWCNGMLFFSQAEVIALWDTWYVVMVGLHDCRLTCSFLLRSVN